MRTYIILSTLILTAAAHAGRTSADYAITAEALDFGGQPVASADYTIDGSIGAVAGISGEATSAIVAKHGYSGQLYDLLGYSGLLASENYPPELGTTQLLLMRAADDGTRIVTPTAGVTFSVLSGPLTGISPTGLVTAGAVYQETEAMVGATSAAFAGQFTFPLFVQDTIPDNFGSYAGDGIGDDWQFLHFGLNNPLAAPTLDPDGDGQANLFEFTAGLVPTDPASRFTLRLEKVPAQATHRRVIFNPRLADRSYVVKAKDSLVAGSWEILGAFDESDNGDERTVTDLDATGTSKFYKVEITKP